MTRARLAAALWLTVAAGPPVAADQGQTDAGPPFGVLSLVDEVRCGDPRDPHPFRESAPAATRVATILGRECRVVPAGIRPRWCAYRMGAGLRPGAAYLLQAEFPDDIRRTAIVVNRAADAASGWRTGDALPREARAGRGAPDHVPASRTFLTWSAVFTLPSGSPDLALSRTAGGGWLKASDGFWVGITAPPPTGEDPGAGAAVARLRLYELPDLGSLMLPVSFPAAPLPRRWWFARETGALPVMAADATLAFRAERHRFFGANVFVHDVLLAGRNQGWETGDDEWVAPAPDPLRWDKTLQMLGRYGLAALPYLEYAGSDGYHRARGEAADLLRLDPADPRTALDAGKLLDAVVGRFREQGIAFAGAWFGVGPGWWPAPREPWEAELSALVRARAGAEAETLITDWTGPETMATRTTTGTVLLAPARARVAAGALGEFTADLDRAGPAAMLDAVLAVARDDPVRLGWLPAGAWAPGFPEAVRRFAAAWLALPAVPSERRPDLCADPEVVVRTINAPGGGPWIAVVNLGATAKHEVAVGLPEDGRVTDLVSGGNLNSLRMTRSPAGTALALSLEPYELKALRVDPPD